MKPPEKVSIRPGPGMLALLKHVEYKPWFALAEFVDNSIDSCQKYEKELRELHGPGYMLDVRIEFNEADNKITIRDNAAGIHKQDYPRAFRAAEVPPDNTGLSEFGMGMKSAACWFADNWSVRTTALGEDLEKTVVFDLKQIVEDKIEELEIITSPASLNSHYTIIELQGANKMPIKKTKGKIKEHLASIYRDFIRKKRILLKVDGEPLAYEEPKVLKAPFPHDSGNPAVEWKRKIDFEIEEGKLFVKGFVALLDKMETGKNGFALFRRGRVIEGSGSEDAFMPKEIMGQTGSPEWKRIFGELHLEGFNVTFTKKGIQWDDHMDVFLDLLKSDLSHPDFPLLKQARTFVKNPTRAEIKKTAETVIKATVEDIRKDIGPAITSLRSTPASVDLDPGLTETDEVTKREFEVEFKNEKWIISLELSYDESIKDWIEIGDHLLENRIRDTRTRHVGIRMSLNHPFIKRFGGSDKGLLEPILRIAAVLGIAEIAAVDVGVQQAGAIRRNINKLLTAIAKS